MKTRFTVILIRPEKPENIGLVARNMKNTGFKDLRLVKIRSVVQKSYVTAVHAREILERAQFYPDASEATQDLDIVFAATAKKRKNFTSLSLQKGVEKMFSFPSSTRIGLLFGNERTGLTSEELQSSNYRFKIPQVPMQPSYNLASAVLITLFQIFSHQRLKKKEEIREKPLSRNAQEECIRLVLKKLENKKFIHATNKRHMTDMIYDLLGRLTMSSKDKNLLLALFSKGLD